MINCERHITTQAAFERICKTFEQEQLKPNFVSHGQDLKTYQCILEDKAINTTFTGCGKGLGLQSQVSAAFEAFEHCVGFRSVKKLYNQKKTSLLKRFRIRSTRLLHRKRYITAQHLSTTLLPAKNLLGTLPTHHQP